MTIKVAYFERERGYGERLVDTEEFDTYETALKEVEKFNERNNKSIIPDCYIYAEIVGLKVR